MREGDGDRSRRSAAAYSRGSETSLLHGELFFDLAFIFALAELTRALRNDTSAGGFLRTLLLLAAIWWVWTVTAWSSDWFSPDSVFVRGLLAWVMFGGLLMAAAIPQAFGRYALVFAGAYVILHIGRGAGLMFALNGIPRRCAACG